MKKDQKNIVKFLNNYLKTKQQKNAKYSQGALARDLGISTGALSQILNGKRIISKAMATKFCEKLKLTQKEQKLFLKNFEIEMKINEKKTYKDFELKNKDAIHPIDANDNWIIFALLNIAKLPDVNFSDENLSKRLNIPLKKIHNIKAYLLENEFLIQNADGQIKRAVKNIQTSHMITKADKQKIHLANLKLAHRSLLNDRPEDREFTSLTLTFDSQDMAEAKEQIREFQNKFSSIFETDSAQSVYKLNIQLFSLFDN